MNDFVCEVLKQARKAANDLLDRLENELSDESAIKPDSLEDQYNSMIDYAASLEANLEAASEELEEAKTVIKLLLDGEVSKVFEVSPTVADTLEQYTVETYWEGELDNNLRLVVQQRKL